MKALKWLETPPTTRPPTTRSEKGREEQHTGPAHSLITCSCGIVSTSFSVCTTLPPPLSFLVNVPCGFLSSSEVLGWGETTMMNSPSREPPNVEISP